MTAGVQKVCEHSERCSERILAGLGNFIKYICFFITNVVIYKQFQSNWSRISLKKTSSSQVPFKIGQNLPKMVKIRQKWSEFRLEVGAIFQYEILCSEQKKNFLQPWCICMNVS